MPMEDALTVSDEAETLFRFWRPAVPGLPKYAQLREALLAAIEHGHWKPGTKLPTEQDLTRQTALSLGTVQRALRALAEEGVVVRQQGSGTYVAESRKPMDRPWHCRFIADDGVSLLPVYPKVVGRRRIRERGPWSSYLGQRGDNVIRIDRVMAIGDEFAVYSRFYLNAGRYPGLMEKPLAELDGANLKAILASEFGLPVTHVEQTVSMITLPQTVCRAVGVADGTPGMLLEIAASTGRNRHVYFQEIYIPPNRRRLVVSDTLKPGTPGYPA
jgi:DNA-binding GntR family transcriptional regulator